MSSGKTKSHIFRIRQSSSYSSGSSGRVRGEGAEKHEIYVAAFGSHLFYHLFSQSRGGAWPPPGSATVVSCDIPTYLGFWILRFCAWLGNFLFIFEATWTVFFQLFRQRWAAHFHDLFLNSMEQSILSISCIFKKIHVITRKMWKGEKCVYISECWPKFAYRSSHAGESSLVYGAFVMVASIAM